MDKEQTAIARLREASSMSLKVYKQPLVVTTSGGKDSSVCVALAERAGIPFEVMHNHTTADAPETVYFVRDEMRRLELKGIKCDVNYPVYPCRRPGFSAAGGPGCPRCPPWRSRCRSSSPVHWPLSGFSTTSFQPQKLEASVFRWKPRASAPGFSARNRPFWPCFFHSYSPNTSPHRSHSYMTGRVRSSLSYLMPRHTSG